MVNRLFGICYQLMQRDKIPAKELAERYEVSVRTIYRDVDVLSMAGVPVYASQGRSGGISLMDHCVIDKMFLNNEEKSQILAALEGLRGAAPSDSPELLRKLGDFFQTPGSNWVSIDFSDWSGGQEALFSLLKHAILQSHVIAFDYYGSDGKMERRTAEPVQLWFKSHNWYLRAWCRNRKAMRTFKVLRIKRPEILDETFTPRSFPCGEEDAAAAGNEEDKTAADAELTPVVLEVDGSQAYRIYDSFGEEEISRGENGNFLIRTAYSIDDWVYGVILSYCPYIRILEPVWLREKIHCILREAAEQI